MNRSVKVPMWQHTCERCGYRWTTKKKLPGNCARCNSPYWNKARLPTGWVYVGKK